MSKFPKLGEPSDLSPEERKIQAKHIRTQEGLGNFNQDAMWAEVSIYIADIAHSKDIFERVKLWNQLKSKFKLMRNW